MADLANPQNDDAPLDTSKRGDAHVEDCYRTARALIGEPVAGALPAR